MKKQDWLKQKCEYYFSITGTFYQIAKQ